MSRATDVVNRLKGPVVPVNLCFASDDEVDFATMRKYINWLCEQKVPVILLTYGSSDYIWLSDADIERLMTEFAEVINGRSLFVVSSNWCPPKVCREFLKKADACGADAVKVQTNPWMISTGGLDPHQVIPGYFDRIEGAADIPLLLWGHSIAPYPVPVVTELAKRSNIVGMKNDDEMFAYYYDCCRATADEDFNVLSGGQMRNYVYGHQVGSTGYLCPIAPFVPHIANEFDDHVVAGRYDKAWQMVFQYEEAWLKGACDLGWLQSLRSAYELYGLFPHNRCVKPAPTHTPEQREQVRQLLESTFGPIKKANL